MNNQSITHSSIIVPPSIPSIKNKLNVLGLGFILIIKSYTAILSSKVSLKITLEQISQIGFNTLPTVILMTTFSGMVISLETAKWLEVYGARDSVGTILCYTSIIEVAPIFVSFALAAQAGTAITAELAHMQITEQISAIRLANVNPINHLVATKLSATIYVLPLAIIIGAFFSILGGMIVSNLQANIEYTVYLDSVWRAFRFKDLLYSLIKGFTIANYIIAIHTAFGLSTRGGAKELGVSTSLSTIWVIAGILCIDTVLDYLMYV